MHRRLWLGIAVAGGLFLAANAVAQTADRTGSAYRVVPLGQEIRSSAHVFVVTVEQVDRKNGFITFRKTADLKGRYGTTFLCQHIGKSLLEGPTGSVVRWARPGEKAVCFVADQNARVCLGNCWYHTSIRADERWSYPEMVEEFTEIYAGSTERLVQHIRSMLAGREVTITARAPPARQRPASPRYRDWLHGRKGRLWSIKAGLDIADLEQLSSPFSRHFVGWGVGGKEAVPSLIRALKHADERRRAEAAVDLGEMGAQARAAVPALRRALRDANLYVRLYAAAALLRIDPGRRDELGVILHLLRDRDADLRAATVCVLAEQPQAVQRVVPVLAEALLGEKDEKVRGEAAHALGALGPGSLAQSKAIKALIRAVEKGPEASVRIQAIVALRRFSAAARAALPALGTALADRDRSVAEEAITALARFGPAAVPVIERALARSALAQREGVFNLITELGPRAASLAPVLTRLLRHPEPVLRCHVAGALLAVDPDGLGRNAVAVLAGLAERDGPDHTGGLAIVNLGHPGAPLRYTVPALIRLLAHQGPKRRRHAAFMLGDIGPGASDAVEALEKAMKEDDANRLRAAQALVRIGYPGKAVGTLIRALVQEDRNGSRGYALQILAEAGPSAREAAPLLRRALRDRASRHRARTALALWRVERPIPGDLIVADPRQQSLTVLIDMLDDPKEGVRDEAMAALAEIGPEGAPVVPALVRILKRKDHWHRRRAAQTLGALGVGARQAEPALRRALKDEQPRVRLEAAVAVGRIDPHHPLVVPALLEIAQNCPDLAEEVAAALADLKTAARAAVPWLLRALRDEDAAVSQQAGRALLQIDPEAARKAGVP
jgi:HEAT repeat protein